MEQTPHIPVLSGEVLRLLNPHPGETCFDGTAGYGGHARMVHDQMGPTGKLILVDRDADAITHLRERFGDKAEIIHSRYLEAAHELVLRGRTVDMVLLDLGVSSPQLDQPGRGFSFSQNGPLDMRMNQSSGRTAADIINDTPEGELADLIYAYGEERKSRRIARAIVNARPLTTTQQLSEVIVKAAGRKPGEIHPATRTFQALRIAVNRELDQLTEALPLLTGMLNPGGRIAVISFHSLEDRIVKDYFRQESRDCICPPTQPVCTCDHSATLEILTKRPLPGTLDAFNPRARSAKLRAAVKLKPKQRRRS